MERRVWRRAGESGLGSVAQRCEDYEPKVDVSYTMGKHAMKFGASYNRYTKNQKLFLNAEGSYQFIWRRPATRSWTCCLACPPATPSHRLPDPALRQPDPIGLCDGYLEGDASSQPAARSSL